METNGFKMASNKIEQEDAYNKWSDKKDKKTMGDLVKSYEKLINSEVGKYQGTLDRKLLSNYAKQYFIDAVKNYDPDRGVQLSTHIVNNLQRLHRLNYKNVQGLRAPEEIQAMLTSYLNTKSLLSESLGREPEDEEISEELNFDVSRIKPYLKFEQGPSDLLNPSQHTETSREEEMLDMLHYDLPEVHKKILEYKTGYNNSPILSGKEIAKKLKISPVRVSQISELIGKKLYGALYENDK